MALAEYATTVSRLGTGKQETEHRMSVGDRARDPSRLCLRLSGHLKTLCHFKIVANLSRQFHLTSALAFVSLLFARHERRSTFTSFTSQLSTHIRSTTLDQTSVRLGLFWQADRDEIRTRCIDLLSGGEDFLR